MAGTKFWLKRKLVSSTVRGGEGTCLPCSPEDQAPLGKRARLWHEGNALYLEQKASFGETGAEAGAVVFSVEKRGIMLPTEVEGGSIYGGQGAQPTRNPTTL